MSCLTSHTAVICLVAYLFFVIIFYRLRVTQAKIKSHQLVLSEGEGAKMTISGVTIEASGILNYTCHILKYFRETTGMRIKISDLTLSLMVKMGKKYLNI